MNLEDIIIEPILTEKSNTLRERKKFAFKVDQRANKIQIKQAVEKMYGVSVESVNTMRYGGKEKSRFTKSGVITGKTKSFKKAIITLAEGETIDFYSNI